MKKKLRIGLILQGGQGWIGGTEYIKNIVFALASLPAEERSTLEICLVYKQDFELDIQNQLKPYLDNTYSLENHLSSLTFTNRLKWKIQRLLFKQSDPR